MEQTMDGGVTFLLLVVLLIVKWFGADEAMLKKIVPELSNFTTQDLGFMG